MGRQQVISGRRERFSWHLLHLWVEAGDRLAWASWTVRTHCPVHCGVTACRIPGCRLDGMERFDRITIEPGKMGGQPCIRGHRFTVEHLLTLVGAGWTLEEIQADFPFIEAGDIQQAAAYAAFSVREYHLPVSRPA
jgi:uncharacterized protein (DUF433 family)